MPDLELYHAVAALTWIREWMILKDKDLLDLEGAGTCFGWHAYLVYDEVKVHRGFLDHIIPKSLYKIWLKYRLVRTKNSLVDLTGRSHDCEEKRKMFGQHTKEEDDKLKLEKIEDI